MIVKIRRIVFILTATAVGSLVTYKMIEYTQKENPLIYALGFGLVSLTCLGIGDYYKYKEKLK